MNNTYVTDTIPLILRLEKRKLSPKIKDIFEKAENGEIKIIIPAMVFAEIGYLSEKKKIETTSNKVKKYCQRHHSIIIEPITEGIIEKAFQISDIPELHDRIIAATSLNKRFALITNDPVISESRFVKAIW